MIWGYFDPALLFLLVGCVLVSWTARSFTVPCKGCEARKIHWESNPRPMRHSPLHYRCGSTAVFFIILCDIHWVCLFCQSVREFVTWGDMIDLTALFSFAGDDHMCPRPQSRWICKFNSFFVFVRFTFCHIRQIYLLSNKSMLY